MKEAQAKLLRSAHRAGMAEIATHVLHNIGNILNSVNISSQELADMVRGSKVKGLKRANNIIREKFATPEQLEAVLPKGGALVAYYLQLERVLEDEHHKMTNEIRSLIRKVALICDVVATQQEYANAPIFTEKVNLRKLMDDALKLEGSTFEREGIEIRKRYESLPRCRISRVKSLQVFANLIKYARESLLGATRTPGRRMLSLSIELADPDTIRIVVAHNGKGYPKEKLSKVFAQEIGEARESRELGLHLAAVAVSEMGGRITVDSKGPDQGASFVVTLPFSGGNAGMINQTRPRTDQQKSRPPEG